MGPVLKTGFFCHHFKSWAVVNKMAGVLIWKCILIGYCMHGLARLLTRDLMGGGPLGPPWWFFVNNSNSVGNSALKFLVPLRASILRILWKNLTRVTQGVIEASHVRPFLSKKVVSGTSRFTRPNFDHKHRKAYENCYLRILKFKNFNLETFKEKIEFSKNLQIFGKFFKSQNCYPDITSALAKNLPFRARETKKDVVAAYDWSTDSSYTSSGHHLPKWLLWCWKYDIHLNPIHFSRPGIFFMAAATSLLFYRLWPCLTSLWRHCYVTGQLNMVREFL